MQLVNLTSDSIVDYGLAIASVSYTHLDVYKRQGGDTVQQMLSLGVNVIAVFSLIFLYYTNSFMIRRRQSEFGLYHICLLYTSRCV